MSEELVRRLLKLEKRMERVEVKGIPRWVHLTAPLTSTSWDGDAYSSVGSSTLIDLSAVFGVPAGVKAVLIETTINDSGSAGAGDLGFSCGPSATYYYAYTHRCSGLTNDAVSSLNGISPCDANGDVYYRIAASGAGAMDISLRIWGYWI